MRKYLFQIICVLFLNCTFSCNKITISSNINCPLDSSHLLGKYKISSIKMLLPLGAETDVTNKFDSCALDDTMAILSGKIFHNIDKGTAISCNNDYFGTWNLSDSTRLSINSTNYTVVGFNCNTIVLAKDSAGFTFNFYYNKL